MADRLHSRGETARQPGASIRYVALGAAVAIVVGVGVAAWTLHGPATGGVALRRSAATRAAAPTTTTTTPPPLAVTAVAPATGSTDVGLTTALNVTYSAPLAADSPDPLLSPPVAGTWFVAGRTATFTPTGGYLPYVHYTVTVPATTRAAEAGQVVALGAATSSSFTAGPGDELRLQQLLAELHYLPLTFTPTAAGATEANSSDSIAMAPVAGTFTWTYPSTPASLEALWSPGTKNELTVGAVMAFESDNGLVVDGVAGPAVWSALTAAVAGRQTDAHPYDYLSVTETLPETLTVWQNGADVYSTRANTGIAAAPTPIGTWPVYLRFASTTMTGTDPDGTKYSDPNIPWVAYFNGSDAVHGFVRASYGFPQSVGCVELPVANAQVVWGMDGYGTLVTVS